MRSARIRECAEFMEYNEKRNRERDIAEDRKKDRVIIELPLHACQEDKEVIIEQELLFGNDFVVCYDWLEGHYYRFRLNYPYLVSYQNEWRRLNDMIKYRTLEKYGINPEKLAEEKWGDEEPGTR